MKSLRLLALLAMGTTGSLFTVSCHFYNRTPFDLVFSMDIPLARDKEITIPAGAHEVYNTGIYPVRSLLVHALINRLNGKKPKKVLVYEYKGMKFVNMKCALFLEPLLVKEEEKGAAQLHLKALKFWAAHETPSHGEQLDL
jgi:hypothetical protein